MITKSKLHGNSYVYQSPTKEDIRLFLIKFDAYLTAFTKKQGIKKESIYTNRKLIIDICINIDKRQDYHQLFHSNDSEEVSILSRTKETALISYWVIKYKPLTLDIDEMEEMQKEKNCSINELFAIFIIKSYILEYYNKKEKIEKFFNEKNNKNLIYNFMHREISKESMIILVNSIYNALIKTADTQ